VPSYKIKFLGVTILQGVEFSIFLLIFEWALQQCSATPLPVIKIQNFLGLIVALDGDSGVVLLYHRKRTCAALL